ncbi:hypothetical protein AB0K00_44800 [Dactylosporangium sp. NPDC049525]|uniref:hypothetical protein n=1 Tax=Dactylosporangium sp. NPDC049525 TaxID=3154730 RepID=UPI0034164F8E
MQPDYRLAPGNLVDLYADASHTGNPGKRIGTAEVHVVLEGGAKYKVRVLTSTTVGYQAGQLADVDATLLHQQGLQVQTGVQLSASNPHALLGDPRVTQYLSAQDRGRLAVVDKDEAQRHVSVQGKMAVTTGVLGEIVANLKRAEPALRPDLGEVGTVSWMIIDGNPYAGVGGGAGPAKDQPLTVRVFLDGPLSSIRTITTAELDHQFELTLRARLGRINEIAEQHVAEPVNVAKGAGYAVALRSALASYATTLSSLLGARPAPDAATATELEKDNATIRESLRKHLAAATKVYDLAFFVGYLFHKGATEKQMWVSIGSYVETLPEQAAVVDLVASKFSRQGDGKFLLVATRRYAHLISPKVQ